MGSNDKEAEDREKPIHNVTVSNFYMGKTEVTHKEWRAIMGGERTLMGGSSYNLDIISCDDCPIELVSWDECQTFLEKLNNKTGKNYRLPTEAEWEYAAKGGNQSKGYKYAGSNDIDKVAWYWRNSGDKKLTGEWGSDEHNKNNCKTHPVAQKQANELGLYDMSGNVYEWCQDRHEPYGVKTVINPTKEKDLVLRGGDWRDNDAGDCRTSSRSNAMHYVQFMGFGFRIALSSN